MSVKNSSNSSIIPNNNSLYDKANVNEFNKTNNISIINFNMINCSNTTKDNNKTFNNLNKTYSSIKIIDINDTIMDNTKEGYFNLSSYINQNKKFKDKVDLQLNITTNKIEVYKPLNDSINYNNSNKTFHSSNFVLNNFSDFYKNDTIQLVNNISLEKPAITHISQLNKAETTNNKELDKKPFLDTKSKEISTKTKYLNRLLKEKNIKIKPDQSILKNNEDNTSINNEFEMMQNEKFVYNKIVNISLSLILVGVLLGIIIGLILVMYLSTKL